MTKNGIRLGIAFALFLLGYSISVLTSKRVYARESINVPKIWGHCIGYFAHGRNGALVYEDNSGVVRVVDVGNGDVVYQHDRN